MFRNGKSVVGAVLVVLGVFAASAPPSTATNLAGASLDPVQDVLDLDAPDSVPALGPVVEIDG